MHEKKIGDEAVKLLTADELFGILNQPEDDGQFVLDLEAAREERAEELVRKHWITQQD